MLKPLRMGRLILPRYGLSWHKGFIEAFSSIQDFYLVAF
jgi:hypothetical protein